MIHIDNLQVRYGSQLALDLEGPITIEPGERVGIIGSNGAGKTTLLNALLKLIPSRGTFRIDTPIPNIAVHLQQNNYAETMAVKHVIETVTGTRVGKDAKLDELIGFFGFGSSLKKRFHHLSGGQKQRMTLILVLYQDAPLVFFDEVTSGLDYESRQGLVDLLIDWYDRSNTTLCYITHYYEELEKLADKILYLDEGRLIAFGDKEDLFSRFVGRSVYVLSRTPEHEQLIQGLAELKAPAHLIALSSPDVETDMQISTRLNQANVNYKRSTSDVEIMSFNAKAAMHEQNGTDSSADSKSHHNPERRPA